MIQEFDYPRPDPEALRELAAFGTATIHEAMGQKGALPFAIKPIAPGMRLCGPALTVECTGGDNLMLHAAIAGGKPGDVLVVDYEGYVEAGPFGDILATACQARGIVGLVIDGCVRDLTVLRDMNFPAFARGASMKGTSKKHLRNVGAPISCAGVPVEPGDAVIADDDGVVIVPRAEIAATVAAAQAREDKEAAYRQKLKSGATTVELLNLAPILGGAG